MCSILIAILFAEVLLNTFTIALLKTATTQDQSHAREFRADPTASLAYPAVK